MFELAEIISPLLKYFNKVFDGTIVTILNIIGEIASWHLSHPSVVSNAIATDPLL